VLFSKVLTRYTPTVVEGVTCTCILGSLSDASVMRSAERRNSTGGVFGERFGSRLEGVESIGRRPRSGWWAAPQRKGMSNKKYKERRKKK